MDARVTINGRKRRASGRKKERRKRSRGNEIGSSLLLRLPSLLPDVGRGLLEVLSGDLVSPVSLDGLLDLSVRTWGEEKR